MTGKSIVDGEGGAGSDSGDSAAGVAPPEELLEADLILFSTSACHLCEEAERLLQPWVNAGLRVAVEDISESDELFDRYGLSIPVLRRCDTGAELNWPFDQAKIGRFIDA